MNDDCDDAPTTFSGDIASGRDENGRPAHRGWAARGGRRRWMAPFILVLLGEEPTHGYALIRRLQARGVTSQEIDIGQVYKTLHCLETLGHVRSSWSAEITGRPHRNYELTDAGRVAPGEWAAGMAERARPIGEFEARYRRATSVNAFNVPGLHAVRVEARL
jgi:PadR family transcriptional regulator